jgi:methyltransferase-like protein
MGEAMGSRLPALRVVGEVVRREIAGETILVPLRGRAADMRRMYSLNPTAAFAWERIDGTRGIDAILEEVLEAFAVDPGTARADLEAFVATALAEGLLEEAE